MGRSLPSVMMGTQELAERWLAQANQVPRISTTHVR